MGAILLGARRAHTLHLPPDIAVAYLQAAAYPLCALARQFILQFYLNLRLDALLGSGFAGVGASALLFTSAHVLTPTLLPVTFLGSLILCKLFRRYRTVYVLALMHALVR